MTHSRGFPGNATGGLPRIERSIVQLEDVQSFGAIILF